MRVWDLILLINDNSNVNLVNPDGVIFSQYDSKNNIDEEYEDLIVTGIRHTPEAIEIDCISEDE